MNEASRKLFFFILAFIVFAVAMGMRLGPELADDGAFFLRYAENMTKGQFWVWNTGEAPVWGASAPLYPLLIALPIKLGVPSIIAMIGTSIIVGSLALALTGLMLAIRFGSWAGFSFIVLASLDSGMMYFNGSGLETPLTIALLAFALGALLFDLKPIWVGLAAGLLMVQKLDLGPVGAMLLAAYTIKERRISISAIATAAAVAVSWYGFAWWHFGAPVPNSFLTKAIYQQDHPKSIDWRWFGQFVLIGGIHKWLLLIIVACTPFLNRKQIAVTILLAGLILIHLAAYTVKYPFEPYNWYCMPSVFALLVFASVGLANLHRYLSDRFSSIRFRVALAHVVVVLVLASTFLASWRIESQITSSIINFASNQEYDRSEAGRWVSAHTPSSFNVFTLWGNPAYFSNRVVIDGSFLNRKYEQGELIKKYKPEILILQNNPGSTPMTPVFAFPGSEEYKVVKVFDKTFGNGMDYFFAVLARSDVVEQISDVDPPRNLMPYIYSVQLGDQFGLLKPIDKRTLFLHPGASTPTQFDFDLKAFLNEGGEQTAVIEARVAPNIPVEAIARGAAVIKLIILKRDQKAAESIIQFNKPLILRINKADAETLHFVVDNNGSADTDWLLISVR